MLFGSRGQARGLATDAGHDWCWADWQ